MVLVCCEMVLVWSKMVLVSFRMVDGLRFKLQRPGFGEWLHLWLLAIAGDLSKEYHT